MYFHTDDARTLAWLETVIKRAKEDELSLRFQITADAGLKVKLGGGMWTAPFASTPDLQRDKCNA